MHSSKQPKRSVALPDSDVELIKKAYHGQRSVKSLAGYSGARVYQIINNNRPEIVKIAHPAIIKREANNHDKFVWNQPQLKSIAPDLKAPIESDDHQWSLLRYTYAGTKALSQTLLDYLKSNDDNEISKVLQDIFYKYGEPWYGASSRTLIRCGDYYDRLLPENLQLKVVDARGSHLSNLDASSIDSDNLAEIEKGSTLHVQGFKVEKERDGAVTIYTEPAENARIKLKVSGVHAQPDEMLTPLDAEVHKTRKMLFDEYIQPHVNSFKADSPDFTVDGHKYPNPVYHLKELLHVDYYAQVSTIHGDLNLTNILVELADKKLPKQAAPTKAYSNCWLIDFATTGKGPVLLDLQWLETQVITWLLASAIMEAQQKADILPQILQALHDQRAEPPRTLPEAFHKCYRVLREIRQVAANFLAEPGDWSEYYRGLTLALLGTIKFEEGNTLTVKLALIGAAKMLQWAKIPLPKEDGPIEQPKQTTPAWHYLAVGSLGVALTVGLLFLLLYFQPDRSYAALKPLLPTATPTPALSDYWPPHNGTILARVQKRGYLTCGVNGALPGFSYKKTDDRLPFKNLPSPWYSNAEGLDADFCRAIAIAIFGSITNTVAFTDITITERFTDVREGKVDVLLRNTSWTADRDIREAVDFGPVIFHDGQKIIVRTKTPCADDLTCLQGKKICVLPGSTSQNNLTLELESKHVTATPQPVKTDKDQNIEAYRMYKTGECDAYSSDASQLLAFRSGSGSLPEDYLIPSQPFSYEPLAPVVAEGDSNWRDVVSYAIWATIYAEQARIDKTCVARIAEDAQSCTFMKAKNSNNPSTTTHTLTPKDREFLGLGSDRAHCLGAALGFDYPDKCKFALNIIKQLGNYEEIYINNIDPLRDIGRHTNQVLPLLPDDKPRLFSPPFPPPSTPTPKPR